MAPVGRLQAIEIWTAPVCVGTRVCTIAGYREARSTYSIDNDDSCSFVIDLSNDANAELVEGRVIVYVYAPLTPGGTVSFDEFYLTSIDRAREYGSNAVRVAGRSLILALSRAGALTQSSGGAVLYEFSDTRTITEWIDTYILPALVARGFTFVGRGTVDFAATYTLAMAKTNGLDALNQLKGLTLGEFRLRKNGTTNYLLDFVTAINSSAAVVYLHSGRSLLSARVASDAATEKFATRILPYGALGCDAANRTISRTRWRVSALDGANKDITVESPDGDATLKCVRYDGQFTTNAGLSSSAYVVCVRSGRPFQLTNTYAATQKLRVAALGDLVVGDEVEFRVDQSGLVRTDFSMHPGASWASGRFSGYASAVAAGSITLADQWAQDPIQADDEWNGLRFEAWQPIATLNPTAATTAGVSAGYSRWTVPSTASLVVGDLAVYTDTDNAAPYTIHSVHEVTNIVSGTQFDTRYWYEALGSFDLTNAYSYAGGAVRYLRVYRLRTNVAGFVDDSTAATNILAVTDSTNVTVNDLVLFYRMDGGTRMTTLPSPNVATYGEHERTMTRDDLRGEVELLRTHNPHFNTWTTSPGMPDGWTLASGSNLVRLATPLIGPGTTYVAQTNSTLARTGYARALFDASSNYVVMRGRFRSPAAGSWVVGASQVYLTMIVNALYYYIKPTGDTAAGAATEFVDADTTVEVSYVVDLATLTTRQLSEVVRLGIAIGVGGSSGPYCGGVTLLQASAAPEAGFFCKDQRANTLWHEGNVKLDAVDVPLRTYEFGLYDLSRLDPSGASADALDVGVTVVAEDAALFGASPPSQRIVRINADHSYPARSTVEVDRLPERITTTLATLLNG